MTDQSSRAQTQHYPTAHMVSVYDPYLYHLAQSMIGAKVVVETVRGTVRGTLCDVKPDHMVVESHGYHFFVRIQQIIWIMPQAR